MPYTHIGEHVDLRISQTSLEVWQDDQRLASHRLLPATAVNQYSTRESDLPAGAGWRPWDPERVHGWAERIGPATTTVIERIFESVPVADQGINPGLAVLRLSHRYSAARLEAAAQIGLSTGIRSPRYAHLQPILATSQDQSPAGADPGPEPGGFVRGDAYYSRGQQ